MMDDLYPYELPVGVHPMAWVFLGFGLDEKQASALGRHVFDRLGARLNVPEREQISLRFAINYPLEMSEPHEHFTIGDTYRRMIAPDCGVRLVDGHLPPGIKLNRSTGEMDGEFTKSGLYRCVLELGPEIKYDALGTPGGPGLPGEWINIDAPRFAVQPELRAHPATLEDLPDEQKAQMLADLLAWELAKAAEARNGN